MWSNVVDGCCIAEIVLGMAWVGSVHSNGGKSDWISRKIFKKEIEGKEFPSRQKDTCEWSIIVSEDMKIIRR